MEVSICVLLAIATIQQQIECHLSSPPLSSWEHLHHSVGSEVGEYFAHHHDVGAAGGGKLSDGYHYDGPPQDHFGGVFQRLQPHDGHFSAGYHHGAPIPQEIMVDVINNLGLALLQVSVSPVLLSIFISILVSNYKSFVNLSHKKMQNELSLSRVFLVIILTVFPHF